MGHNPSKKHKSLRQLADALLEQTEPGHPIFAVGINALVVLHALAKKPDHFSESILLAPVGAFLWQRSFVKVMALRPIRKTILYLLRHAPGIFKRKFTDRDWPKEKIARMGKGYQLCRSFEDYFDFTTPMEALDFFEQITSRITLVWGEKDAVLNKEQLTAWAGILPRANLNINFQADWGHYPYIDDPRGFALLMEQGLQTFPANTKAGRLKLASMVALPVPKVQAITDDAALNELELQDTQRYAIRASTQKEDQADRSGAGLSTTYLDVRAAEVKFKVKSLLKAGVEEVVVQPFISAQSGGVAFIRNLNMELEWVHGHPQYLLDGQQAPDGQFLWSAKKGYWGQEVPEGLPFPWEELKDILQRTLKAFHYMPLDVEWLFDGKQIWLVQARPVTRYAWKRSLTSANIDELLPDKVSRMMELMQQGASMAIGRAYAAWDTRCLEDNEPFTVAFEDASYINLDLFLSRFADWGLPSALLAKEIGSYVPKVPFNLLHFLKSIPVFLKMLGASRKSISQLEAEVKEWHHFWTEEMIGEISQAHLAFHLQRYYAFMVRRNIHINAALSSDPFSFLGSTKSVYGASENKYWRLPYESDPATSRGPQQATPPPADFPKWTGLQWFAHKLGLPGMGGKYLEVREWFRDENMKVFYHLHYQWAAHPLMQMHPGARVRTGTFFENNPDKVAQMEGALVIVPGKVEGIIGRDILIVDVLQAGNVEEYRNYKAIVAKAGGRLSHGATLLREFGIPSAIIPQASNEWKGARAMLNGAILEKLEN